MTSSAFANRGQLALGNQCLEEYSGLTVRKTGQYHDLFTGNALVLCNMIQYRFLPGLLVKPFHPGMGQRFA